MAERTDHNEAMRLADALERPGVRYAAETEDQAKLRRIKTQAEAAALLRQQAERIAELERDYGQACRLVANLHTAATGSMQGPKRGVVEDVADVATERDQLRAEVERLRVDADRYVGLKTRHAYLMVVRLIGNNGFSSDKAGALIDEYADAARAEVAAFNALTDEQRRQRLQDELDAARTTHKDEE